MSVHGEYARALASVLTRVADSEHPDRDAWLRALDDARATAARDLSTAARSARSVLDQIDGATGGAQDEEGLRDACRHLRAHCHAILGGPVEPR